ncbi:MAG: substrate-binding domain-containing protein [Candidatus Sumerlaeota bacterium]
MSENPERPANSHLPAHNRVRRAVVDAIASGQWQTRIPSERNLAERLGVSHMTARRAVCDLVDEGVLIRGEGRQGTFIAKARAPGRTGVIGVLSPLAQRDQAREPYAASLLAGVQELLCERGLRLHLAASLDDFFEKTWQEGQPMPRPRVDGVIKLPCKPDPRFRGLVRKLPAVAISTWAPGLPRIAADDVAGAQQGVEFLVKKGHRRIAHLSHRSRSLMSRDRRRGYEQAMEQAGLAPMIVKSRNGRKSMEKTADRLLEKPERPSAVFCSSDESAASLLQLLWDRGIRVPSGMSVLGFGDLEMARHLCPPLTTLSAPLHCLARSGAKWLLEWIESGERPEESARVLPVEIIERESVREV